MLVQSAQSLFPETLLTVHFPLQQLSENGKRIAIFQLEYIKLISFSILRLPRKYELHICHRKAALSLFLLCGLTTVCPNFGTQVCDVYPWIGPLHPTLKIIPNVAGFSTLAILMMFHHFLKMFISLYRISKIFLKFWIFYFEHSCCNGTKDSTKISYVKGNDGRSWHERK